MVSSLRPVLCASSSPLTYGVQGWLIYYLIRLTIEQLMPDDVQYDANATPPQFTNNADMVIEPGTHVRVKIIGLRTEVGEMWAIGSINGDYLGLVQQSSVYPIFELISVTVVFRHRAPAARTTTRKHIPLPLPKHTSYSTSNTSEYLLSGIQLSSSAVV